MEEDELTKQRALDAAAAVAVAAAAAAQQTREAATASVNDSHGTLDDDDDDDANGRVANGAENHIDDSLESLHTYAQQISDNNGVLQDQDREENGLTRKFDDTTGDYSESFVAASDPPDQEGETAKPRKSKKVSVHHTKRRKINTCLPCKRRKVKCDRERPYCGQCKKHDFPLADCTWSVFSTDQSSSSKAVDASTFSTTTLSNNANTSNTLSDNAIADSAAVSAAQWLDMSNAPWANFTSSPAEQTIQALQNRILSLEATIEKLRNEKNSGDTMASKDEQTQVQE